MAGVKIARASNPDLYNRDNYVDGAAYLSMTNALNELVVNCMKKQEVAKLDKPEKFIQPDFSHFTWNIGDEFLQEAKELYGY